MAPPLYLFEAQIKEKKKEPALTHVWSNFDWALQDFDLDFMDFNPIGLFREQEREPIRLRHNLFGRGVRWVDAPGIFLDFPDRRDRIHLLFDLFNEEFNTAWIPPQPPLCKCGHRHFGHEDCVWKWEVNFEKITKEVKVKSQLYVNQFITYQLLRTYCSSLQKIANSSVIRSTIFFQTCRFLRERRYHSGAFS